MGMVRDMLLSSSSPDWGHAERFATDFGLKLNEDTACWQKSFLSGLFGLLRVVVQGESLLLNPIRTMFTSLLLIMSSGANVAESVNMT
jgi:hypothetical protein